MSKPARRTKNTCRQCGSSWTPRNVTVSNMCPECGSREVVVTAELVRPKRRAWPVVALVAGAVLVVGGGIAAAVLILDREPATRPTAAADQQPQPAAAEGPFKPGDAVRVKPKLHNALLADPDVADEVAKLRAANNGPSIRQLLKRNKVAEVPGGTTATVLGVTPSGVRVRIADGGWRDREGVLPADALEPAR